MVLLFQFQYFLAETEFLLQFAQQLYHVLLTVTKRFSAQNVQCAIFALLYVKNEVLYEMQIEKQQVVAFADDQKVGLGELGRCILRNFVDIIYNIVQQKKCYGVFRFRVSQIGI
ncbi:hypothetical protein SS50377_21623 [Spironucleus salmonicida]|uniref:Uncharacterized protein n=1 Tax=Spironucleus salmonicida TaxID=348837 RepID=A0A9P8S0E6_9EUKA|nr:hypothetical protein SS50377_21623 [Spironucleus salmonicida]